MTELTGRHVALIFVAGFGTIIAVNLALAVNAVRTFPGLETANSYVASQSFDARRAAQEALGWDVAATYDAGVLSFAISGPDGRDAPARDLTLLVGRPTEQKDDRPVHLEDGRAVLDLAPGPWRLDVSATAPDGTAFQQIVALRVPQ